MTRRRLTLVASGSEARPAVKRPERPRALPTLSARDLSLLAEPPALPAPSPRRVAAVRAVPPAAPPAGPTPQRKLAELARVHAERAGVLTAEGEQRLLEYAVQDLDLTLDEARAVLARALRAGRAVRQRDVEPAVREFLAAVASRGGRIARRNFDHAVAFYRTRLKGALPEAELRRRVKAIMVEGGWRPKGRRIWPGPPSWYRAIS